MLSKYMKDITELLAENADLMSKIAVYPSANYPGRTQEGLLLMLVRKKLEPPVQALVDEAREMENNTPPAVGLENEELGDWAYGWLGHQIAVAAQLDMQDQFTQLERQIGV
jgi:mediator of RNA polymerase II transcription subunit 8